MKPCTTKQTKQHWIAVNRFVCMLCFKFKNYFISEVEHLHLLQYKTIIDTKVNALRMSSMEGAPKFCQQLLQMLDHPENVLPDCQTDLKKTFEMKHQSHQFSINNKVLLESSNWILHLLHYAHLLVNRSKIWYLISNIVTNTDYW